MNISRREFLNVMASAGAAGMALAPWAEAEAATASQALYDLPPLGKGTGHVSLLHMTDCHAQLMPLHFREPSLNLGIGNMAGQWPHLVEKAFLNQVNAASKTTASGAGAHAAPWSRAAHGRMAHAFTSLHFEQGARRYGKVGGFAHIATLVKQLKASRPGALLLDGGDTWQGSATSLWTNAQDMVNACLALGVDVMTGHWEFSFGMQRVQEIVKGDFKGRIDFIAQNVKTQDFGDPVFPPYTLREINGAQVAIIGQAFPYTPIANPRYLVADWQFGIQEESMQAVVDEVRGKGVHLVVLLSHNGMDVDLKLASRVRGIDAILGGHTHDGVPVAVPVRNAGGTTLVTNAGSHGKFLGVLDVQVNAQATAPKAGENAKLVNWRYRLLPVFSNILAPDAAMQALISKVRAPYEAKLSEKLATTQGSLYRRGNFNGSWDQLLCDALMQEQNCEIAFSPGFRWGSSLLPGQAITRELLMDQLAITYPYATATPMTGEAIKTVLEDVADNLFNPDPYYQQGGDMVRVGGLTYAIEPMAAMGQRISDMRLNGQAIGASKTYKVAGWAPVAESAKSAGLPPVWELVERWLKAQPSGTVAPRKPNVPRLIGMQGNAGWAA